MKSKILFLGLFFFAFTLSAQEYFPKNNGVKTPVHERVTFTNAYIQVSPQKAIKNGYMVIDHGKIVSVGKGKPKNIQGKTVDLDGNYIYPSFIDVFANMKLDMPKSGGRGNFFMPQYDPKKDGYYWNDHINPEFQAFEHFNYDPKSASSLRKQGFGVVSVQRKDGVARGNSMLLALNDQAKNNIRIIDAESAQHFGFSRASGSNQAYPNSRMGMIALLRQFNYDANWFASHPELERDFAIQAYLANKNLPMVFDAGNNVEILRANKIADEFGLNYIIKGGGDEFEYISSIKKANKKLIIPIDFPAPFDMTDVFAQDYVSLGELKFWEQAPFNPAILEANDVDFVLTTSDLKNIGDFQKNLKKAIAYGLSEEEALAALTTRPAAYLNESNSIGTLEVGKWANFLVSSGPIFKDETVLYENWVQGSQNIVNPWSSQDLRGSYTLNVQGKDYDLILDGSPEKLKASLKKGDEKISSKFSLKNNWISLIIPTEKEAEFFVINGYVNAQGIQTASGKAPDGGMINWSITKSEPEDKPAKSKASKPEKEGMTMPKMTFPNMAYGASSPRTAETILFKNATVWTNESEGILKNTDVLVKDGKIAKVGQNLRASGARVIDASGKHLTTGIIDEHTHIAAQGINEGGQNSSAEVRISDVINSEDVNIYRNLAGGVTTAQILHGSANPIGGQSAIIKMKWGVTPDEMVISDSPKYIKFALGENVKQSRYPITTTRFPQSRMGVEQLFIDYFSRAQEYADNKKNGVDQRTDLEMETLAEILNQERFISCHSYVQSEITMLMRVADQFDFNVNTFTHILEGYKVADKMKEHGVGASTFSDWWAYKYEVKDAIPFNGAIMNRVGLTVAFNSDDAEMSRRLNQEAAKAVKYGGISEEEAWKFVTLNPAKLLHLDDRLGSVKVGKDADLVLWDNHPMHATAKSEITMVSGTIYFSIDQDAEMRKQDELEKARIIGKMISEKNKGVKTIPAEKVIHQEYECETLEF